MRTIRNYIDMRAREQLDKIYMFAPEPNLTLTYAQLKNDSVELGKYLYKKGFQKGNKISFLLSKINSNSTHLKGEISFVA